MSSYHDKIAPPVATSTPKTYLGKSNENGSSVVIISPPAKRRLRTVQIFTNLKKEINKHHETFLSKTYL